MPEVSIILVFLNDASIICGDADDQIRIIDTVNLIVINPFSTNPELTNILHFDRIGSNPNEVIFSAPSNGIYKLNLTTHNIQQLKFACENRNILAMSVSPDGTKIIYQLDSFDTPNDACHIRSKSEFHLMNIDGTNDQLLTLP